MTTIGLGQFGCDVAAQFSNIDGYKYVVKVSTQKQSKQPKCKNILLPKFECPEQYETSFPDIRKFINRKEKINRVFVDGKDMAALGCLQLLQQIDKKQDTEVVYLCPDPFFLGVQAYQIHNLTFNVLQEYARSGMFKSVTLISFEGIEKIIKSLEMPFHQNSFAEIIANGIRMTDLFKSSKAIVDNFDTIPAASRIKTISLVDPDTLIHQNFFNLDTTSDVVYYLSYNESEIANNKGLIFDVRNTVRDRFKNNGQRVYYGIFASKYEKSFICCEQYTSTIQQSPKA
jgi:hypothetical protein